MFGYVRMGSDSDYSTIVIPKCSKPSQQNSHKITYIGLFYPFFLDNRNLPNDQHRHNLFCKIEPANIT